MGPPSSPFATLTVETLPLPPTGRKYPVQSVIRHFLYHFLIFSLGAFHSERRCQASRVFLTESSDRRRSSVIAASEIVTFFTLGRSIDPSPAGIFNQHKSPPCFSSRLVSIWLEARRGKGHSRTTFGSCERRALSPPSAPSLTSGTSYLSVSLCHGNAPLSLASFPLPQQAVHITAFETLLRRLYRNVTIFHQYRKLLH